MEDRNIDAFINAVLEEEKADFRPGLETFEARAAKIRGELTKTLEQFQVQYSSGYDTLCAMMAEKGHPLPAPRPEALALFDEPGALQNALEQGNEIYALLEFSPEVMKQFFAIGVDLLKKGDFAKAKDVFYFLVTIASQSSPFWLGLGISFANMKNYEEAQTAFRQTIDLDPHNADAYLDYMNILLKQNAVDEALKVCEDGLHIALANSQEPWSANLQMLLEGAEIYLKRRML